jgi:hypothetical protein
MRERAEESGDAAAKTRAAVVSNLILACALTAPLAYILSDVPLSLGFAWRDMSWHVLLGGVGCVALLALGGAYWRSRMVPDSPVTPARVASIFARLCVLVAGLVLLPLALEHHGVGAWARYTVVFLALAAFEFWRLQNRKVVWDAPKSTAPRAGAEP